MFILVMGIISLALSGWLIYMIVKNKKLTGQITVAKEELIEEEMRAEELQVKSDVRNLKTQNDKTEEKL